MNAAAFTIEYHWQKYLRLNQLSEETMFEEQRVMMKRTFYCAWGMMLVLMKEELAELPEDDAVRKLEGFTKQVGDFMEQEVKEFDERKKGK